MKDIQGEKVVKVFDHVLEDTFGICLIMFLRMCSEFVMSYTFCFFLASDFFFLLLLLILGASL